MFTYSGYICALCLWPRGRKIQLASIGYWLQQRLSYIDDVSKRFIAISNVSFPLLSFLRASTNSSTFFWLELSTRIVAFCELFNRLSGAQPPFREYNPARNAKSLPKHFFYLVEIIWLAGQDTLCNSPLQYCILYVVRGIWITCVRCTPCYQLLKRTNDQKMPLRFEWDMSLT